VRVSPAALRFPRQRVLLGRTRLAYVHLQNLLTDAKRDRAARVFGYVVVWLPEELLLLYLQEGEVVAATTSEDGVKFSDISIREARSRVPNAAEYGEVCFHEADDEQLACMHAGQVLPPEPMPPEVKTDKSGALFAHLLATTYDGMLEINAGGGINYVVLRHGVPRRAFFADGQTDADLETAIRALWKPGATPPSVRRWAVPPPLPNQAPPPLIDAYRALMHGLSEKLTKHGVRNAAQLLERARETLVAPHPALNGMALGPADAEQDPVTTSPQLARAIGGWINEVLFAVALPDGVAPENILRELIKERRHLFQSAGLLDALAWKVV
jgi:hypothetical protein